MGKRAVSILLSLALLLSPAALAMTRDALRAAWQEIAAGRSDASPYLEEPDVRSFSVIGAIPEEKLANALDYLNFIRSVAGVEPVSLSEIYSLRCQNAALLLSANDAISHSPSQPDGMHGDLYESALLGASQSNLAAFNWISPDILLDGIEYFVRDDGDRNLSDQGHRRWLLSPYMAETGFGLASAESGASYVVMYAVDSGNENTQWEHIAWPAAEAFPVELMRAELAWSLTLNDAVFDLSASNPVVTLTEQASGARFSFKPADGSGDGFCCISTEPYGGGSCIIFRPKLAQAGIDEYVQNQVWEAAVTGLVRTDGSAAEIRWRSEMVSLYPQDAASVEISQLEANLALGETLQLSAQVVPAYADNLHLRWFSTDGNVAMVNASGLVTALGTGSCRIIAESHNGRQDACEVTVT